jgi:hypothetical protein
MRKQPDFDKVFRDYFGESPKKVTYVLRHGPDFYHDIVFLCTLVHDARFCPNDLTLRGTRLTIPIKRDCWEIPLVSYSLNSGEMYFVHSRITISPVLSITWEYNVRRSFGKDVEMELQDIWLNPDIDCDTGQTSLTLAFFDCKCTIETIYNDLQLRVTDLEVPYLRSKKKTGKQ